MRKAAIEPTPHMESIENLAKKVLLKEASALQDAAIRIDAQFAKAVSLILASSGRVSVSGIGKSALVAQKIVATMNSTGQPAFFMHAADAIHGDLGMLQATDVLLLLSQSGNTPEVKALIPLVKQLNIPIIAITGNAQSYLGSHATAIISSFVAEEADPLNLAPTSSTTLAMALGDALAIALLVSRGFQKEDFARFHPGGALGKRLHLKVSDLYPSNAFPKVEATDSIEKAILEITTHRLGATAVLSASGTLQGIVTDGDLRRMLANGLDFHTEKVANIMTKNPKTIAADAMATEALSLMQNKNITQLLVEENGVPVGFIHLHDLLREGLV